MSHVTAELYTCESDEDRAAALDACSAAVQRGEVVVIPTDTVYGIAADAFDADAVADLLEAKGRGRDMPPPVMVSNAGTVDALAVDIPGYARALMEAFWPGALTLVLRAQPSLQWDLGETRGTVAVRTPDHPFALALLDRTGPLAVSSANTTGSPAAVNADQADDMLGEDVDLIVDDGESPGQAASTIVDATDTHGRILRLGALSLAELNAVLEPLGATLTDQPDQPDEPTEPREPDEPEPQEPQR